VGSTDGSILSGDSVLESRALSFVFANCPIESMFSKKFMNLQVDTFETENICSFSSV